MMELNRRLKNKEGFTVVEVVVALAIAAIVFVGMFNSISNIRKVNDKANSMLIGHSEITSIGNKLIDTPSSNRKDLIDGYIKKSEATGGLGFRDHPSRNTTKFRNTLIYDLPKEGIRLEIDLGQGPTKFEAMAASKESHRIIIRVKRRVILINKDTGVQTESYDRGIDDIYAWKTYE